MKKIVRIATITEVFKYARTNNVEDLQKYLKKDGYIEPKELDHFLVYLYLGKNDSNRDKYETKIIHNNGWIGGRESLTDLDLVKKDLDKMVKIHLREPPLHRVHFSKDFGAITHIPFYQHVKDAYINNGFHVRDLERA
ncbi:MAG: hypothetical protein ABIB79_02965 [archaeon]